VHDGTAASNDNELAFLPDALSVGNSVARAARLSVRLRAGGHDDAYDETKA